MHKLPRGFGGVGWVGGWAPLSCQCMHIHKHIQSASFCLSLWKAETHVLRRDRDTENGQSVSEADVEVPVICVLNNGFQRWSAHAYVLRVLLTLLSLLCLSPYKYFPQVNFNAQHSPQRLRHKHLPSLCHGGDTIYKVVNKKLKFRKEKNLWKLK